VDDVPRVDTLKRQNPHMHLLEAFLALYDATHDAAILERADAIVELLQSRFCCNEAGVLHEYFSDDWGMAGPERSRVWEPGHHYEWCWLLHAHAQLTRKQPISSAKTLFDRACADGFSSDGRIFDELRDDNLVLKTSTRAWPLTEAAKAGVAMAENGVPEGRALAASALGTLMDRFMGKPWPAGWIDHLDAAGQPIVDYAPASTLYHMVLATAEANRPPQQPN
jgi:mannose-6-phosphate isomerase